MLACAFLFPSRYLIMTEILRLALFALSLDLILGYAGIVSLGHAAFFGVGAYSAGLLALHGIVNEPVAALVVAGLAAAVVGFLTSFLVIRGVDLTRLMVTLGIALLLEALAERFSDITGGTDGLQGITMQPILGLFAFDMFGKVGFFYSLVVLFLLFLLARRIVHSPFGLSLRAIRNNPLRAAAIGIPVNRRLIAVYTLAAFYAGIAGALFTQTTALASLDVFSFERSADLMLVLVIGGTGYLYGGLIGAVVFRMLQEFFSNLTPQYWQFWIGLVLVVIVLVGRQRLHRWALWVPNPVIRSLAAARPSPPSAGATRHDLRAGNPGARKAVRRAQSHPRPFAEDRGRRAPRRDRPERRRQDHRHQPSDRRAQAQCRTYPAPGQRHHRFAGA